MLFMNLKSLLPLLFLLPQVKLELRKWEYRDFEGRIKLCCICHMDFTDDDLIEECHNKNAHDPILPFCNCFTGSKPECESSTTVCDEVVTCNTTGVYKECEVPFITNTRLKCNDSLKWEPNFICPVTGCPYKGGYVPVGEIPNTRCNCTAEGKTLCENLPTNASAEDDNGSAPLTVGEIVAIVVGIVAIVGVIIIAIICWDRITRTSDEHPLCVTNLPSPARSVQLNGNTAGGNQDDENIRDPAGIPHGDNNGNEPLLHNGENQPLLNARRQAEESHQDPVERPQGSNNGNDDDNPLSTPVQATDSNINDRGHQDEEFEPSTLYRVHQLHSNDYPSTMLYNPGPSAIETCPSSISLDDLHRIEAGNSQSANGPSTS